MFMIAAACYLRVKDKISADEAVTLIMFGLIELLMEIMLVTI